MTPAARIQAAIEILDEVIISSRDDGPPADTIVTRYFKTRRYAGSSDRRVVRELVFRTIRRSAERPESGRAAILGLAADQPDILGAFGEERGPAALDEGEPAAAASLVPLWLQPHLSELVGPAEWPELLQRAPVDLRVNARRASRDELMPRFPDAVPTRLSPWGLRLPPDSRIDDHPDFRSGAVEVQDEGSQLIAFACGAAPGERIVDLCAGAGGKALALGAAAQGAIILASDSNRARLSQLPARAERAGIEIEPRLLNPPRELQELSDWRASADLVLVDAPCSGSGTWRRNPEGRWRLTPERLRKVALLQTRLLDIAAPLVKPGGTLVYAVCSIISAEGAGQIASFLGRHSSWLAQDALGSVGRKDGDGRLLTPGHDGTDGFFVARLQRPC